MQKAVIVDIGNLFDYANEKYSILWNDACDLFNSYYTHDGYTTLESECRNDLSKPTEGMVDAELADRIVEEFTNSLDVPKGYMLLVEG